MLARFLLSAWFGAATLFVITGVREVTHSGFDSMIRDQLAVLRFPVYYACGFAILGSACVSLAVGLFCGLRRRTMYIACGLTAAALGLMAYDYPYIYCPMASMITPPGQARAAEFRQLHLWSETVNAVQVGCVLGAALILCAIDATPVRQGPPNSEPPES